MTDPKAELKRCDLKKQSQFAGGQIDRMLVITMIYGDLDDLRQRKNKANSKPISSMKRFFAYGARDCHDPSGLAMTMCKDDT